MQKTGDGCLINMKSSEFYKYCPSIIINIYYQTKLNSVILSARYYVIIYSQIVTRSTTCVATATIHIHKCLIRT